MHSGSAITAPSPVTTLPSLAPPHINPFAVPKPHFMSLTRVVTMEQQITELRGASLW